MYNLSYTSFALHPRFLAALKGGKSDFLMSTISFGKSEDTPKFEPARAGALNKTQLLSLKKLNLAMIGQGLPSERGLPTL